MPDLTTCYYHDLFNEENRSVLEGRVDEVSNAKTNVTRPGGSKPEAVGLLDHVHETAETDYDGKIVTVVLRDSILYSPEPDDLDIGRRPCSTAADPGRDRPAPELPEPVQPKHDDRLRPV